MDEPKAGDPMFPVASITTLALPTEQAVLIRLDFLTGPMHDTDRPTLGRNYVLSLPQAEELARQIQHRLHVLRTLGAPGPSPAGTTH